MNKEPLKVLLINTSESTGGAAVASKRLFQALNKHGVEAKLFVKEKQSDLDAVVTKKAGIRYSLSFLWERFVIWLSVGFKRSKVFQVDIANAGVDITREKAFQEADIIHLHWINQGMFSMRQLGGIITSGKPVVWTLHDMWAITGICHHARACTNFHSFCVHCPYLSKGIFARDLSYLIFNKKRKLYLPYSLNFVGCSQWIANEAKKSALTKNQRILSIPNPISIEEFYPKNQQECREKLELPLNQKLLLFGAVNALDKRKGFELFIEACMELKEKGYTTRDIGVVAIGNNTETLKALSPFPVFSMGYVQSTEQMVDIYNAVDLYVTSSLEENLPNMIMESMACGTPCVGFDVGGIPEMIDHKVNGYVSVYENASSLVEGIRWILENKSINQLKDKARAKVVNSYAEEIVTSVYIELYETLLNNDAKQLNA